MDRKATLEAKRAKLEELKRQRQEKQRLTAPSPTEAPTETKFKLQATTNHSLTDNHTEHEVEIINDSLPKIETNDKKNKPSVKEIITYDKAVETDDNYELEPELSKSDQRKIEKELRHKLEDEITSKLEKEYQRKLQKSIDQTTAKTEILKNNKEIEKLFNSDPHGAQSSDKVNIDGKIDEFNTNRDSKYAKPLDREAIGTSKDANTQSLISLSCQLFDDTLTENKVITAIDWSPFYPELLLASYSDSSSPSHKKQITSTASTTTTPGLIIIWNMETGKSEFLLLSYTKLSCAKFSKHKSNQVIGGGYNGKMYLWELDSLARFPITSTTTRANHQSSSVISIVENSNSIVSLSSNGLLSIHSKNLINLISETSILIPNTSLSITASYINNTHLIFGTSVGELFKLQMNLLNDPKSIQRLKSSVVNNDSKLPIMSIDSANKSVLVAALSHQVTYIKDTDALLSVQTGINDEDETSARLNSTGLIMDVKFRSAVGEGKFVAVGSNGCVEYWDLSENKMNSVYSFSLHTDNDDGDREESSVNEHLNKVEWRLDGSGFVTGGLSGVLHYFKMK